MDKLIRKEQIVQLREHDMNRGHNKSKTPVYPVTVPEAILGGVGRATVVETLPEEGQEGTIYYSNEDNQYYKYTEEGFKVFGTQSSLPIVTPEVKTITMPGLQPDQTMSVQVHEIQSDCYNVIVEPDNPANIMTLYFGSYDPATTTVAKSFVGRFTAKDNNQAIGLHNGIHFPSEVPDIEAGHTYEFNVLYDTILITDITPR